MANEIKFEKEPPSTEKVLSGLIVAPQGLPIAEYARRPHQEISRAYQLAHEVFTKYQDVCTEGENPYGETYLISPEVYVHELKKEGMKVSSSTAVHDAISSAKVQLATRKEGREPVLNMPYCIVVNGNITAADLRINPSGTFELGGDSMVQLNRVEMIGEIADLILTRAKDKSFREREDRKFTRRVVIGVIGVLGVLGYGGYKVYDHFHDKHVAKVEQINTFDAKNVSLDGQALSVAEPGSMVVEEYSDARAAFSEIPRYDDSQEYGIPRRFTVRTGECRSLWRLGAGTEILVEKQPNIGQSVVAIAQPDGQTFVCAPDYQSVGSGESREIVTVDVVVQARSSTEG